MPARIGGYAIVLFWLAAMAWLVRQDVWPALTAGEAPRVDVSFDAHHPPRQLGVFNKYGHRIGTIWSSHPALLERRDTIHLHNLPPLEECTIRIRVQFTDTGELDEFTLNVKGLEIPIELHGERYASVFGFSLEVGPMIETFKIGTAEAGLVGDAFQPFATLPGLKVGQSWRMQVVNPLAAITGFGSRFTPILVRVTGREVIELPDGQAFDCLVVEAPGVKAWVDAAGLVLVQEVEFAVGGKITLRAEPYDEEARRAVERRYPSRQIS